MHPPMFTATKNPDDVDQLSAHPVRFSRVIQLFRPHRATLALVIALIIVTSGLTVVQPFLVRETVDVAIPQQNVPLLVWLVLAMIGLTILSQFIGVTQSWLSSKVGQNIMHELSVKVFGNLQRQSLQFFTRNRGGEVQSRLTNDIAGMRGVVTTTATSVATNLTMTIATIIAMVALSPTLSLLSLVVLPPAVWLTRQTALMRRRIMEKNQQAQAEMPYLACAWPKRWARRSAFTRASPRFPLRSFVWSWSRSWPVAGAWPRCRLSSASSQRWFILWRACLLPVNTSPSAR